MTSDIGKFKGYLSSIFPSQINLDVTMFCNLKCIHCPYESVTHPKGKSRQHLNIELHNKVIDEISQVGAGITRFLRYTGDGEPLIHPQVVDLIAYAKSKSKLPINLTTNGTFLNGPKIAELVDAGVNVFDVSIDAATQSTYERIRVGGDFSRVQENTKTLIQFTQGKPHVSVVVSFVSQPLNHHELLPFKAYWENQGVKRVIIRNGHSAAGSIKSKAAELWASAPSVRTPCLYPWERLVVKADGEISYCPADWHHIAGVGNIKYDSLQKVWKSSNLSTLRAQHIKKEIPESSLCGGCPDWYVIKWPHEAQTYASLMHEVEEDL